MLALIHLACFCEWDDSLSLGERSTLLIVATDKRQAKVIFRYLYALLSSVPELAAMIGRETSEIIDLSNGIAIEITTASFRSIRGPIVDRRPPPSRSQNLLDRRKSAKVQTIAEFIPSRSLALAKAYGGEFRRPLQTVANFTGTESELDLQERRTRLD